MSLLIIPWIHLTNFISYFRKDTEKRYNSLTTLSPEVKSLLVYIARKVDTPMTLESMKPNLSACFKYGLIYGIHTGLLKGGTFSLECSLDMEWKR